MFDSNLLFHDAAALTASGNSSGVVINKTPIDGVDVEIVVTAVSGTSPTLDIKIQESDNDSSYNDLATIPQITAVGRYHRHVASKKKYLRINRTIAGTTPSFTVTAGVVSGQQRDFGA